MLQTRLSPLLTLLCQLVAAQKPQNGPNHIACYQDFWPVGRTVLNAVNTTSDAMTIEVCKAFCSTQNYIYYGLEYQNQCYCGNQLPYALSNLECDQSCFGNPTEACGGNNSLSTYFTQTFPNGVNDLTVAISGLQANLARAQSAASGTQLSQLVAAQETLSGVETQNIDAVRSAIAAGNSALAGYSTAAATSTLDSNAVKASLSSYASQISVAEATATGSQLSSLQAAASSVYTVLQASITDGSQATGAVQAAIAALGIYQGAITNAANNLAQLSTIESEIGAALRTAQSDQSTTLVSAQLVISSILNNIPTVTTIATQAVDSGIAVGLAALASPTSGVVNVAELISISSQLAAAVTTATAARLSSIQNAQTIVSNVLFQATGSATQTASIPTAVAIGLAALATQGTDAAGDSNLAALSAIQDSLLSVGMTATGSQASSVSNAEQTASVVLGASDSAGAVAAIAIGLAALNGAIASAMPAGSADALDTLSSIDSALLAAEATASGAQKASLIMAENTASAVLAGSQVAAAPSAIAQGLAALRGLTGVNPSATPARNANALATLSTIESELLAAESTASGARRASIVSAVATASAVLAGAQISAAPGAISVGLAALMDSANDLASLSAVDSRLIAAEATATGLRLSSVRSAEAQASSVLGTSQSQAVAGAIAAGLAALGLTSGSVGNGDGADVLASLSSVDSRLLAAEVTASGARLASLQGAEMTASGVLAQSQVSAAPSAISAGLLALEGMNGAFGSASGTGMRILSTASASGGGAAAASGTGAGAGSGTGTGTRTGTNTNAATATDAGAAATATTRTGAAASSSTAGTGSSSGSTSAVAALKLSLVTLCLFIGGSLLML